MEPCIYITEEDNSKPYLYYIQAGYWNVKAIAKKQAACGYIVQEVIIINTTGILCIDKIEHYYEAWRVTNGRCEEYEDDNPDDTFRCGIAEMKDEMIKMSLGKSGVVKYECNVYWIDENDYHFDIVDTWQERTVNYAAKLKSIWADQCTELEDMKPIYEREFIHSVHFMEKDIIKEAIAECYEKQINGKDDLLQYKLIELLGNTKYEDLAKEICSDYNLGYDIDQSDTSRKV